MTMKFVVYFLNSRGHRDGVEVIEATSANEAKEIYRRYFNFQEECVAIRRIEFS